MKRILSICFCLMLSFIITVAFSPDVSFAGVNDASANSHYGHSSSYDEEDDSSDSSVAMSFMGKTNQADAYKLLTMLNSNRSSDMQFKWDSCLEEDAISSAADNELYWDFDDTDEFISNEDSDKLVFIKHTDSIESLYDALKSKFPAKEDNDADTVYTYMGAAEVVASNGLHCWAVCFDTAASGTESAINVNSDYQQLTATATVGFGEDMVSYVINGPKGTYGGGAFTCGNTYNIKYYVNGDDNERFLDLVDYDISSSDNSVISVTSDGTIKAKKAGNCYLDIYPYDNEADTCSHFYVAPNKVSISKAKGGKNSISMSWSKAPGASGYCVYYSTSGNGKYKYAGKVKNNSCKIIRLKSKRTYYVKVKPYVTASFKIFGKASAAVKVRTT